MAGIREVFEIVDKATSPLRRVREAMQDTSSAAEQLKKAALGALSFAAVAKTVSAAVKLSDELTQVQARINGITGSLEETARIQGLIYQAAQRSRGSYQEMMGTVAALKSQTGDTFASMEEATAFAEALQKQFKIAGTDATGISSTMYNLTQALSTGVLRGQDLNIVMSNAPQIAQRIAKEMGITVGELKKVASEGKVTSDIVKSAMLGAAEDIDKEFGNIPKTFGDLMTMAKNMGVRAFEPVGKAISNIFNSPAVQGAIGNLGSALYFVASVAGVVLNVIGGVFNFFATIFGVLFQSVTMFATQVLHVGDIFVALSTVIGAVFGGIGNIILIVANLAITIWEAVYNFFLQICDNIGKAFAAMGSTALGAFSGVAHGADAAATAIANAFISGANAAIGGINKLIDALNKIPGVEIGNVGEVSQVDGFGFGDAIDELKGTLDDIANAPPVDPVKFERFDTKGLIEGFTSGAQAGADWAKGVREGMAGQSAFGDYSDLLGDIANNTANAVPNGTGKVGKVGKVDNVKLSDEDLKVYRDLAERRYMNNIELKTLAPEITVILPAGASGNISAQDVADRLKKLLIEQMSAQTAVSHG